MIRRKGLLFLMLMASVLGMPGWGLAQQSPKPAPPPPQPPAPIRFPAFEQKTLPNGLRVVVIEHHEQPAVSLRLLIKAGAIYDPPEKPGVAQATAALLDQGTQTRSAQDIAQAIDFVGGQLNAGAGWDSTFVSAAVTSDHLDLAMELLADIVLHPIFKDEEIERWRKQTLSGLRVQMQDPKFLAAAAFQRLVFGQHPYARPIGGTSTSVRAIRREDMVQFHRTHYRPNTAIIAIVGDVRPTAAFAAVEKYLGGWKAAPPPPLPSSSTPERRAPRLLVIDKPDAVQTEIRIGQVGIARTDPDYFVAQVFNAILGGGSGGRLFREIRSRRGLTYGAYSQFAERLQPGYFWINTYTKTESTVEAIDAIFQEIDRIRSESVPADELQARKAYITGAFPLQIETPDGIATQVLDALFYGYGKEYLETYRDRLRAVTAEQVMTFAKTRIHPDRSVIVLVGNAKVFEAELKQKFPTMEKIAYSDLDLLQPDLKRKKDEAIAGPVSNAERARAMAILEATIRVLGGDAFIHQKSQITRGTGTISPPGAAQEIPVPSIVNYTVLPEKMRMEFALPFGTLVQGFNGQIGWMSMAGQVRDQTAQMKESSKYGFQVLRQIHQPGYRVRPLADAEVAGTPALVVAVSDAEGHTTEFFIDPHTHLVLKTRYRVRGQQLEETYAEYQAVDGIQVPHRVTIFQNGVKLFAFSVGEVEINPDIDESLFEKPEG